MGCATHARNIGWRSGLDLNLWVQIRFPLHSQLSFIFSIILLSEKPTFHQSSWTMAEKVKTSSCQWNLKQTEHVQGTSMETWLSCHFGVQVFKKSLNRSFGPKRWKITFSVYILYYLLSNFGKATWHAQSRPPSVLTHNCSQPNTTFVLFLLILFLAISLFEDSQNALRYNLKKSLNRIFLLKDDDGSIMLNTACSCSVLTNKQDMMIYVYILNQDAKCASDAMSRLCLNFV